MDINELTSLIKVFAKNNGKSPTISEFADIHNLQPATIIKTFGPWNNLLLRAGLKPNKSSKRTEEDLISWLKIHPNARYSEIPNGIRSAIINKFGSIGKARTYADLAITDWRLHSRKPQRRKKSNAGRPIEYTKELIITGLQNLAKKLGKPPKPKDITKKTCGFPFTAIISRFGSFNEALKESYLPPSYSYQEYNKLNKELHTIMINIKINTNDVPLFYNIEDDGNLHTFIYKDRYEEIFLTRSNIIDKKDEILKYLKPTIVWYLVDDSLYENDNFEIKNILDLKDDLSDKLKSLLLKLRLRYDEINRTYIAPIHMMEGFNEL